ncbi:universal stress protein [Rapidithrix thailandica]|uniref:Universal stress protein n=1 Tax=Rapidithrix thailandica TaxID=413964 RepID=A0AAW9S964_9BACT
MKSILVPIDFSATSINALHYAIAIAKKLRSSITLFNSFQVPITTGINTPPVEYIETLTEEREQDHKNRLQKIIDDLEDPFYEDQSGKIQFVIQVLQGLATDMIEEVSELEDFDMIIMGTSGASGFNEFLWGSITAHVMDRIHIPMMAIPEKAQFQGFRHLVYATDFQDQDIENIDYLKVFCELFDAELTILHVNKDEKKASLESKKLHQLEENYWFTPVSQLHFKLIKNKSAEKGLLTFLKENNIDLIAVMPQHRGFIEGIFHSSVCKRLTYHSDTPVLVMWH